jgi:hypothetical protein
MKTTACAGLLLITLVITSFAAEAQDGRSSQVPGIEGTYKLVARQLPDGTMLRPPDVTGLATWTKTHFHFDVLGKLPNGQFFSLSHGATYSLTATTFSKTNLYTINQLSGKKEELIYDVSSRAGASPVTIQDGRVRFLLDDVAVTFDGYKNTATIPGQFIDYWEAVR